MSSKLANTRSAGTLSTFATVSVSALAVSAFCSGLILPMLRRWMNAHG